MVVTQTINRSRQLLAMAMLMALTLTHSVLGAGMCLVILFSDVVLGQVSIYLGGSNAGVSQQLLHVAESGATS